MISLAQANSMGHGEAEKLRGLQVVHRLELGYFKNQRISKISVPAANIAFNGLPDQIRRTAEVITSARERYARPSTAKGMVAAPFIGACFEMGCRRRVFGGLHHSRMGELHSRSQGLADYAVGSRSWSGFRADDPWRTSERIDPACGNGCRPDPRPAKRRRLADR